MQASLRYLQWLFVKKPSMHRLCSRDTTILPCLGMLACAVFHSSKLVWPRQYVMYCCKQLQPFVV